MRIQAPGFPTPCYETHSRRTSPPEAGEVGSQVRLSRSSSPTLQPPSKAPPTGKPMKPRHKRGVPESLLSVASLDVLNSFLLPQPFLPWLGIYLQVEYLSPGLFGAQT